MHLPADLVLRRHVLRIPGGRDPSESGFQGDRRAQGRQHGQHLVGRPPIHCARHKEGRGGSGARDGARYPHRERPPREPGIRHERIRCDSRVAVHRGDDRTVAHPCIRGGPCRRGHVRRRTRRRQRHSGRKGRADQDGGGIPASRYRRERGLLVPPADPGGPRSEDGDRFRHRKHPQGGCHPRGVRLDVGGVPGRSDLRQPVRYVEQVLLRVGTGESRDQEGHIRSELQGLQRGHVHAREQRLHRRSGGGRVGPSGKGSCPHVRLLLQRQGDNRQPRAPAITRTG